MSLFFHVGECHAYLAIQGNHIVDGDDLFTVTYSNRRPTAAPCVCSARTRYNFDWQFKETTLLMAIFSQ
jgi:hypothetical protein